MAGPCSPISGAADAKPPSARRPKIPAVAAVTALAEAGRAAWDVTVGRKAVLAERWAARGPVGGSAYQDP